MLMTLIDQISEDIVETIHEPLLVMDSDLKVILANRQFLHSFKVTREETLGNFIYDLGNSQWNIPKLRELLETILPENASFDNYEVEHDFATIGRRTMLLNARQIERGMGKERIILLAIEDITERKQAETLLKNSEEQYRRIFENADNGILLLEKGKLKIRHANPAFTAMLGYSNEELIGKDLKVIGFPDKFAGFQEILQTLNKDGIAHFKEVAVKNKAGQSIYTDIFMANKAALVQCNIYDITERKRVEQALQESEALKNMIIESSPDCINLLDLEGNLKYMSKGGQERLEIKDIKVYLNKSWIDFWQGKYNANARMAVDTAIKGDTGKFRGYSPTETGKPRWWDVVIAPIKDLDGEVEQLLAVSRDITEQKQMEDHLRHSQQLESIGTLAGGIAHDFNNILSSVIGYTELALDGVEKGTLLEDNLQEVYTAGKRARGLVKQILTFARQTEEELKPIQVDLIVQEVLKFIRSSLPTTIEIKQNIECDSLIMGNAVQIHQIMMNLCANAAYAMKDDTGVLEISLEDVQIGTGVPSPLLDLKAGDYIKLSVSDTGTGISPSVIENVFTPYFTTKDVGEGTGMGLSVVHGIVETYGGKITVDSELGKGTTFSIYFPVTKKRDALRPYEQSELPTGTERILFVDDELPIAKMGSQILEELGYQVAARTGSMETLELFKQNPNDFDLVITDMTMPNMSGDKLAIELMKIRPDIPVILCSGYSGKISDQIWKKIGIKAFAYKPVIKADLAETVRKVLDEAKSSAQS